VTGGISAEYRGALLEKRRQPFGEVRTIGDAGELLQLLVEHEEIIMLTP
jgi:hypothetical protein